MTALLFRDDAYLREATAVVTAHTAEGAIVLDRTAFYPTGGGQPGDSGLLIWAGGRVPIATAIKLGLDGVALLPAALQPLPPIGTPVVQHLDWERRYRHMRMHTALHLLSVVVPLPVTGGQIGDGRGRLDFAMPEMPAAMEALNEALNALVERDLLVSTDWITDAELLANPGLVKTMRVQPPMGQGRVRLVRIGQGAGQIDFQPCGGTHVARTGEIGHVEITKIENKGRQNRRLTLSLIA